MLKKIPVARLQVGMFVADFNAGWMSHPFLSNQLAISDVAQIEKIRACGIRELFIDTERGDDVHDAPTAQEARQATEKEIAALASEPLPGVVRKASLKEELTRAHTTFKEAKRIIHNIMDDVRLGHQLELAEVRPLVAKIASSVMRNPNAMQTMRRLKNHDDYTFLHSVSVSTMLVAFACALDYDEQALQEIAFGGLLHDIGKMRVALGVLNKPAKLDEGEFSIMKGHVLAGSVLLHQHPDIPDAAFEILEQHHERYDGSGYPYGLQGPTISTLGRMSAIVDVYDAITSERVYHKAISPAEAMRRLFEWSKFHFDPQLVQAFVRAVGIYPVGTLVRLESGRLGFVIEQHDNNLLNPRVRVMFDAKRNYYITPVDVDLARPLGNGGADRIVGYEAPQQWGIDPDRFLHH